MVGVTNLQKRIRRIIGIQEVFESAQINTRLLNTIVDEQRRLRLLIAEQFSQKSPITFEQMDAIMVETRDRLDIAIASACQVESMFARVANGRTLQS